MKAEIITYGNRNYTYEVGSDGVERIIMYDNLPHAMVYFIDGSRKIVYDVDEAALF